MPLKVWLSVIGLMLALSALWQLARDVKPSSAQASQALSGRQILSASQLAAFMPPKDYTLKQSHLLKPGLRAERWEKRRPDPARTVRLLQLAPEQARQLEVLFSARLDHYLSLEQLRQQYQPLLLMNWAFFGRLPAGDIQGLSCRPAYQSCQPGLYQDSQRRTGQPTSQRYCYQLDQTGQSRIERGSLRQLKRPERRLALCGGVLLFDQTHPGLYRSVGTSSYLSHYRRLNEPRIIGRGQGGEPERRASRTAIGSLPDGQLVLAQLGEGRYQGLGGLTPAEWAALLKELGLSQALMFDGSGATAFELRDAKGHLLEQAQPYHSREQDFRYNASWLMLRR